MDLENFLQSKLFKRIILGILVFLVILLVFKIGMVVGTRKADFSNRWSENYYNNFGGPRGGFLQQLDDRSLIDANGIFGQIIKIDSSTNSGQALVTIKSKDNIEKLVVVNEQTSIKRLRDNLKINDLKINDFVVIIGEPNNSGQIEAKFIRVMPPPPMGMMLP